MRRNERANTNDNRMMAAVMRSQNETVSVEPSLSQSERAD
jgi:hypothetical protein